VPPDEAEVRESLRTKLRASSGSRLRCLSSKRGVGRLPRMDVTERRRLCTTPCIFGNIDLRTACTNCSRGNVAEPVLLGLSEREEVVMRLEGRISWNVDSCSWGGLLGVAIDSDSDDRGGG